MTRQASGSKTSVMSTQAASHAGENARQLITRSGCFNPARTSIARSPVGAWDAKEERIMNVQTKTRPL